MAQTNFNKAVTGHMGSLKPFALNLTKDMDDAEDLLQETMYRAITNSDKYREGTNLKAWLFTIMKNIFINNYRRKSKRNTIMDSTDNMYYINSGDSAIENAATSNFVMEDARNAIKELNDEYRVPFMMHYEGFKYHEIAEELRLPLGTVKSRIFFARKELKDKLRSYARK